MTARPRCRSAASQSRWLRTCRSRNAACASGPSPSTCAISSAWPALGQARFAVVCRASVQVVDARFAEDVDRCQRRRRGDRVAAGGRGGPGVVRPGQPLLVHSLHDLRPPAVGTDREAATQPLAVGDEVGRHAVILLCTAEGQSEAGDHFVEHQHNAVPTHSVTQALQKPVNRWDATVQRLDDHGGQIGAVVIENLLRRREVIVRCDQHITLDPRRAGAGRIGLRPLGRVVANEARDALRVLPVVRALEFQNLWPPGRRPCRAQAKHRRLGAAGNEPDSLHARADISDAFRQFHHRSRDGGEIGAPRSGRVGCLEHFRVGMTDERCAPRHGHVEVFAAVGIPDSATGTAVDHRRVSLRDAVFTVGAAGQPAQCPITEVVTRFIHFLASSGSEHTRLVSAFRRHASGVRSPSNHRPSRLAKFSATSSTSAPEPHDFTPSVIIVRQNGQPTATVSAPVATASFARSTDTR